MLLTNREFFIEIVDYFAGIFSIWGHGYLSFYSKSQVVGNSALFPWHIIFNGNVLHLVIGI